MVNDFFAKGGSRSPVEVPSVLDPAVVANLCELLELGALFSLAVSSDGGTLAATVTHDGEWVRAWFRDASELAEWIGEASASVEARVKASASNGQRSGNRGAEGRRKRL